MKRYTMPIVFYARLDVDAPDKSSAEEALNMLFNKHYYGADEDGSVFPDGGDMNQFRFEDYERQKVEAL